MTLSILCVTNGEEWAGKYIQRMYDLACYLGAPLVLGLDRERAQRAGFPCHRSINLTAHLLQEDVMDEAVAYCDTEYVLRLDDDEVASPALAGWLATENYTLIGSRVYAFPRVYMWGDEQHILSNDGIYPDLQTRLGLRNCMFGVNHVHAGNRCGTGTIVPYAIEHHSLLVKSCEKRKEIADRYESLQPGAGHSPIYARYLLPEDVYGSLVTKEYIDGDFSAR